MCWPSCTLRRNPRVAKRGLGLQHRRILFHRDALHQCMRGGRLALRLDQRRLRELHRFLRVAHFLGRDRMLREQRLAFGKVGLGARQLQLAGGDQRVVLAGGGLLLAHLAHRLSQ
jgi:hypothetical protein